MEIKNSLINILDNFSPKVIIIESIKVISIAFYKTIKENFTSNRIPLNEKEARKIFDLKSSLNYKEYNEELKKKYKEYKNSVSPYLNSIIEAAYRVLI